MSYRSNPTRKRLKSKSRKRSSSYKRSVLYKRVKRCDEFMPYYYETHGYPKHFDYEPTHSVKSVKRSNGRRERLTLKYPKSIHTSLYKSCRRDYKSVCRKFLAKPNIHPLTKRKLKEDSDEQHYVQDFCVGVFGNRKKPFKNLKHEKTKVYV